MRASLGPVNCGHQNSGPSDSMCVCQGSSLELGQEGPGGIKWTPDQGLPGNPGLGTSLGLTSGASLSELLWTMISSPGPWNVDCLQMGNIYEK